MQAIWRRRSCWIALVVLWCIAPATADFPSYPVKASADGRYLVDQKNVPYLIHGDTPWAIFYALSDEEAEEFLEDRRRKGFNTMQVILLPHPKMRSSLGTTAVRAWPFLAPIDITRPNEEYFARVDRVLRMGAAKGMQFSVNPMWFSWPRAIGANRSEKLRKYGEYVGKRYTAFDNIIWLHGGDLWVADRSMDADLDAIVEGINTFDRRHLQTVHLNDPKGQYSEQYVTRPWYSLFTVYYYRPIQEKALPAYNLKPALPFFLSESCYEGEHLDWNPPGKAWRTRVQAYCAVLCGASGHIVGAAPKLYWFNDGWRTLMNTPMYQTIVHLKPLFDSRPWHLMVPDAKREVVTAGSGEKWEYVPAARAKDGSFVMAYIPTPKTITVDMAKIGGTKVVGWWFNPRSGDAVAAGTYANHGSRQFTPPSAGPEDDWVLVLDNAAKKYGRAGSL